MYVLQKSFKLCYSFCMLSEKQLSELNIPRGLLLAISIASLDSKEFSK